ncbi:type III secretion protein [Thiorhodococcus mannitoliphagus]|uniref:Flagellar biosynthetic protein FlhB n=1 Tax=Thiorhodococcus mannitoliphagus TaxID=329406 RepID=A0A6P1DVN4_9GAMM|nr:type III secretion protein [Thiorhodococcus mannitoliphagus]
MNEDGKPPPKTKAVALHWDGEQAPRVTASGVGLTAQQILEIAEEHGVPLQQDPVLVEALAQIPVGDEIPRKLYVAVAEVLAFVFALEGIDPRAQTFIPAGQDGADALDETDRADAAGADSVDLSPRAEIPRLDHED